MENQEKNEVKTVQEMCEKYKNAKNEVIQDKLVEECGIKNYLPIADKIRLITYIVDDEVGQVDEDGIATYDGIDNVVYFMLGVVAGYTELRMSDDGLADFDALSESGLMAAILEAIGPDADMFKDMYEMRLNDFLKEHNTLAASVGVIVQAVLKPIMEWSDTFTGFIDENGGIENVLQTIQDLQNQLS